MPALYTLRVTAHTIAIDGPAASGKSAVGSLLARSLAFRFVDTGAMYRAITWLVLDRDVDIADVSAVATIAERAQIDVREGAAGTIEPTTVLIDGVDVTPHLRDDAVETNVSLVSRVPEVRATLVRIQRTLAARGDVVMAGRDIGTVVLRDADLKIYLDATREVRARRREMQLRAAGMPANLEDLVADLARRDGLDSTREASPLTAAPDAVIINTDKIDVEEVVRRIAALARE